MGKGRMLNENEKEIKFRICNSGGLILYFMDMELTDEEQVRMICQLNQWYSDTDQDVEGFVEEFYWFVIGIMDDMILLNPRYLLLEEVMEQFLLLMPETRRRCYGTGWVRKNICPAGTPLSERYLLGILSLDFSRLFLCS